MEPGTDITPPYGCGTDASSSNATDHSPIDPSARASQTAAALVWSHRPADPAPSAVETVGDLLRRATAAAPEAIALVEGTQADNLRRRRWTYRELLNDAVKAAAVLLERFVPGDRIAILSPNCPEWEIVELGAALAGMVLVPLNTYSSAQEMVFVLGHANVVGVVLGKNHRGCVDRFTSIRNELALSEVLSLDQFSPPIAASAVPVELPSPRGNDPVLIQYTSGTTGPPKGVVLTHSGIVANAIASAERLALGDGAVWLNPLPMYHSNGSIFFALGAMAYSSTHVISRFDPELVLELVETEQVSYLTGVPTFLIALLDSDAARGRDLSTLRRVTAGGTTVPAALIRRVEADLGVTLMVLYGQTEAGGIITGTLLNDPTEDKVDKVGVPLAGIEVSIVGTDGAVVPCGEVGEIHVRSAATMREYLDLPMETTRTVDAKRWLHTGDLGTMDSAGRLQITGRSKDVIIRGGENIYPREIEELLAELEVIAEVAVIGVPDDYYGEQIAAVVRIMPGQPADVGAWETYAATRVSHRKVPRRWFQVDEMPHTASGKVRKVELREQVGAGQLAEIVRTGRFTDENDGRLIDSSERTLTEEVRRP